MLKLQLLLGDYTTVIICVKMVGEEMGREEENKGRNPYVYTTISQKKIRAIKIILIVAEKIILPLVEKNRY